MSQSDENLESLLTRANEHERNYQWLAAAEAYDNSLDLVDNRDVVRKGGLLERLAYSLSRAAMQAEEGEEFRKRIERAFDTYRKAKLALESSSDLAASAKAARCQAMSGYLRYWLESRVEVKKEHLENAWKDAKRALESFHTLEKFSDSAKTCNDLFLAAVLLFSFQAEKTQREAILNDLMKYIEEAAAHMMDPRERACNLVELAACLETSMVFLSKTPEQMIERTRRMRETWQKAVQADEEAAALEKSKADLFWGIDWSIGNEDLPAVMEKQMEYVKKANDRLFVGVAKGAKAVLLMWSAGPIEDPDEAKATVDEMDQLCDEARREFAPISFVAPDFLSSLWPSAPSSPWGAVMLSFREMDLAKKRIHATEGVNRSREQLEFAERSQYPYAVTGAHFVLGFALLEAAKCEADFGSKQLLLRESVEHRKKALDGEDTYCPSHFWNRGIIRCQLAQTEFELGRMAMEDDARKMLLSASASRMKEGLSLCESLLPYPRAKEFYDATAFTAMGLFWLDYGRMLRSIWEVAGDKEDLVAGGAAFEKAAKVLSEAGNLGRVAECCWEAARTYDLAGEYTKASARFGQASEHYKVASQKIKALAMYYEDYAIYMQAWAEIEKAKQHHTRQEPSASRRHFQKASELHSSSSKWGFLASNYSAWAQVENGEELSQKEDCRSSVKAFEDAANLFADSRKSLQAQLSKIETTDERQMVNRLIGATDTRQELCKARIVLEEARVLDKEGKMHDASERFGQAADAFQMIQQKMASDQDKKEIGLILTLANAWKTMTLAEAEASPELYQEAARLFEDARNLSPSESGRNLATGHSRFCRALEAGTKFEDTGDPALHSVATDNLESAAKHYLKAGQEKASEYSRASRLLFDAYVQMGNANKEPDHDKKAKLYAISEKILEASAVSFDKADQPGKREQVRRLLERVTQDRELAVSLTEVLRAPDIVSTTKTFSSPTPTHETAVGLDRFEHADIQATLLARPKDLFVGEDFNLEIELVNAGRGVAQLTKVEEFFPHGFDVKEIPEKYRIEDSYLNLKGRRLDAMKTEDVKVVLKPTVQGSFRLKPRIMYLDETGKYKSYEPEPVDVTVKEMGVTRWLKGPEKKR